MPQKRIRVAIADDHQMVRAGLSVLLESFDDLELVGEADCGEAVLELCETSRPDVILMDLVMPRMDGVTATRLVRSRFTNIKIIALTSFDEPKMMTRALEAGANGFLFKTTTIDELADAIRMVFSGKQVIAPEALSALITREQEIGQLTEQLTGRESQVLKLLIEGLNNQQIADTMIISLSTVKTHISHIYAKLGATNRVEAARIAYERGLIH